MARLKVYVSEDPSTRWCDGTRQYYTTPDVTKTGFVVPAILDYDLDDSGMPYTDRTGGWASESALTVGENDLPDGTTEEGYGILDALFGG